LGQEGSPGEEMTEYFYRSEENYAMSRRGARVSRKKSSSSSFLWEGKKKKRRDPHRRRDLHEKERRRELRFSGRNTTRVGQRGGVERG